MTSRSRATHKIAIETEAGQVSAELARRGIALAVRVHVVVDPIDDEADEEQLSCRRVPGFRRA